MLSVRDLKVRFDTDEGEVKAVDGVSFDVLRGEVFAIVGESGSGKSVTAMSMLGLIPNARIAGGEAWWKETDLLQANESVMRRIRGGEIAMIFQDPLTALNPVHKIGRQIGEMVRIHRDASKKQAATGRSSCSTSSASRNRNAASTTTRTSSRAVCASGR